MVRNVKSADPKLGMFPEAAQWAKEITGYIKDKFQLEIQLYADSQGTIYWVSDYADYAAYGNLRSQIIADPGYWDMIKKARDFFVEGSVKDMVVTSF